MKIHLVILSLIFLASCKEGTYFSLAGPTPTQIQCMLDAKLGFVSVEGNYVNGTLNTNAAKTMQSLLPYNLTVGLHLETCRGYNPTQWVTSFTARIPSNLYGNMIWLAIEPSNVTACDWTKYTPESNC